MVKQSTMKHLYTLAFIRGQQWLSTVLHLILSMTGGDVWKAAQESFRDSVCFRTGETSSLFNFDVSGAIFAGLCCWNKQGYCVRILTNTENKVNYRWPIWPKKILQFLSYFTFCPAISSLFWKVRYATCCDRAHAPTLSDLTTSFQMGTSNITINLVPSRCVSFT